jgi:hypothetical protein
MSAASLETLDHAIPLMREWINELDEAPGRQNRHRSYRLLRAIPQGPVSRAAASSGKSASSRRGGHLGAATQIGARELSSRLG